MGFSDEYNQVWANNPTKIKKNQSFEDEFGNVWNGNPKEKEQQKPKKNEPVLTQGMINELARNTKVSALAAQYAKAKPTAPVGPLQQMKERINKPGYKPNIGETLLYNTVSGATDAAKGYANIPVLGEKLINQATGNKKLSWQSQNAEKFVKNAENMQSVLDESNAKAPTAQRILGNVVRSGAAMAPALATGSGIGSAPVAFGVQFGSNYAREAENEGANPLQSAAYGAVMGAVESLTGKYTENILKGIGGKNAVINVLKNMNNEGLQEVISNPIQAISKRAIYGNDKDPIFNLNRELESYVTGAASAGAFGAGGSVLNHIANPKVKNSVPGDAPRMVDQATINQLNQPEIVPKSVQEEAQTPVREQTPSVTQTNVLQGQEKALNTNQNKPIKNDVPIGERNYEDVSKRDINAYQYDHPEVADHIQAEAIRLMGEMGDPTFFKGQKIVSKDVNDGTEYHNFGITKNVSESFQRIQDATGASYEQIKKALENIANDHGHENYAVAKKIELIIDDNLSNGATGIQGNRIEPDQEYISKKQALVGGLESNTQSNGQQIQPETSLIDDYVSGIKPLPKSETELQNILDVIDKMPENRRLNLQFFAEQVRKMLDSKFRTNTIARSVDFTDAEKDMLSPEDLGYEQQTSQEWKDDAARAVNNNRQAVEEQIKNSQAISGGQQAHEAAIIARQYRDEARQTGNYGKLKDWLGVVAEKTRETARALKGTDTAWQKTKSAEGAVLQAQREVQKSEDYLKKTRNHVAKKIDREAKAKFDSMKRLDGSLTHDQVRDMVKKKYGFPVLTGEEVKTIIDTVEEAKKHPDGSRKQQIELAKVKQIIADKQVATTADKIKGLFRIALLSNIKTQVRNVLGNAVFGAVENIKDIPAAGIDAATSKFTGKRVYNYNPFENIRAEAKGRAKGLSDQIDDVRHRVDTSPTRGQMELPSGRTFKNPLLNAIDEVVKTSLKFGDRPYYEGAYARRINELKRIHKTDGITEEMELEAKLYALERTFQGDSELGDWFANMKRSISSPAIRLVVESAIPFTQTPANIFDRLVEYSPAGLVKSLIMPFKARKTGVFNQRQFVDSMARSFTGTGLMMLGYVLAKAGIITGGGDREKEGEFNKLTGKIPYSLKVGGQRLSFDWASPVGNMFAIGANAYKAGQSKEDLLSKIDKTAQGGVDTFFSQSVMAGLQELFGGYSAYETAKNAVFSPLSLANPTLIRQTNQVIDPYERETMAPNPVVKNINKIIAGTPIASQTLPRKVDTLGNEVNRDNNWFNTFLNPARISRESNNSIVKEIQSVYETTGDKDVLPRKAPTKLGDKVLRPQEYIALQKLIGQKTTEIMNTVINDPEYQAATPDIKAKILSGIVSNAYSAAKNEFLYGTGE